MVDIFMGLGSFRLMLDAAKNLKNIGDPDIRERCRRCPSRTDRRRARELFGAAGERTHARSRGAKPRNVGK